MAAVQGPGHPAAARSNKAINCVHFKYQQRQSWERYFIEIITLLLAHKAIKFNAILR